MLSSSTSYDVFIAYNSKDRPKVEEVVDLLKKEPLIPWYDQDISPNESWLDQLHEAIPRCISVAFLIGPNGLGRWQEEELKLVKKYVVEIHKIPVYIVMLSEDLKVPNIFDTYFPFANRFTLNDSIKDSSEFKKLVISIKRAIHDELLKRRFEIEVDVIEPSKGCFLSIPKTGYTNIFNLVKKTFEGIKETKLLQNFRRGDPSDKSFTDQDIFHIIRESELLLSVCVPEKNTENACPEMIYELGLAHALGKPSIVITSNGQNLKDWMESLNPSKVKAQPKVEFIKYDAGDDDKFVCDLKTKVEEITSKLTDPYLISPEVEGIQTFRPDIAYFKSSIISHFCSILSFGISTLKNFSNIAQQCHVLTIQNENLVQIKDENVGRGITQPDETFLSQYRVFRKGCQRLLENQEEWKTSYHSSLGVQKDEIKRAFDYLQIHLLEDLQKYVEKSQKYYKNVFEGNYSYIQSYLDNISFIQKRINDNIDNTEIWPEVEKERTEIELLKKYLKFIDGAIHSMMDELLKIIIND